MGWDAAVRVATRGGLGSPGMEGRGFAHPDRRWNPASSAVGTGGKAAKAWRWPPPPPHSNLEPRLKKEVSYTSTPPPSRPSWPGSRVNFTF
jgi:hypothetical protein